MNLLRTPVQHIVIGEILTNSDHTITIRIKKPRTELYENISLDWLLTVIYTPLQDGNSFFLLSPNLRIKIGEVLRTSENTPALRIKKPRTEAFEVITIDELLVAISQLVALAA